MSQMNMKQANNGMKMVWKIKVMQSVNKMAKLADRHIRTE